MRIIIEVADGAHDPEGAVAAVKSVTEEFLDQPTYTYETDEIDSDDGTIDDTVTVSVMVGRTDMGHITVESKSIGAIDVTEAVIDYFTKGPGSVYEVESGEWEIHDWNEV